MKKCALFIIGFMIIFCGCEKDYFHDTGLANGNLGIYATGSGKLGLNNTRYQTGRSPILV